MIILRPAFAMLTGAAVALAFPLVVIARTVRAQPEPKKPDRKPPQVAAELVGQIGERRAPGPLGIALSGNYAYLAAWRHGLRVVNIADPKEPKEVAEFRIEGSVGDVVVAGGY